MPEARYEIIRQLACGGMAEVLLARQNANDGSHQLVVLKRVLTHLAQNDGFLKMFAHEARIASQLRHQNIVQVLEVGEHEGLPVIVMERLEGADLLRLLQQCVTRRQSLGTAVSMAILAGAARGLGYAHRARSSDGRALRLIHRDISPHNVFITRDGGVKLLDFGIAKSAAHVGLTSTGQVKGKISYMSPEQIRSLPIDARSDLWSLGVVLWETLAGEKLFTRDNDAATLHAILHDPIPPLNRREAPGLDDLIAVTATYESWDFRWAYVVRYAQDFRLTTPERQELLQPTLEAAQQEHEFYVALYTQSRRWGELTRPTSAWRVLLLNDRREEVAPVAIEPINRPGAVELTYFPYTTVWRQAFRIRFPKYLRSASGAEVEVIDERVRSFRLRFSGPLGTTDLVWNVTP